MLTVRHDDADVLAGLEAGADDYVAKDSAPELVLARVQRLIQYRQMVGLPMLNQQLVQVGRLMAGIVHEIRGPLSVIRGSAELLRLSTAARRPRSPVGRLDPPRHAAAPGSARSPDGGRPVRPRPAPGPWTSPPLVREAVDLFVKGLPPQNRGVRIEVDCDRAVPRVRADAGRLIQVLINLLTNAHQAITRSGTEGRHHRSASDARRGVGELLGQDRRRRRRARASPRSTSTADLRALLHHQGRGTRLRALPRLRDPRRSRGAG